MSNFFDFNDAPEQRGELLPAKTLAKVVMVFRPGGHGDGGWLRSFDSGYEALDAELTISSSPYAGRKFWQIIGVGGPTEGHQKAGQISRALLRAILESARGINPKDESDRARTARQARGWQDFNELEFAVEIGIEKGKDGYDDKNKILRVLTPDHKMYQRVMAGETVLPKGNGPSAGNGPAWGGQQAEPKAEPKPAEPKPVNPVPAWAR